MNRFYFRLLIALVFALQSSCISVRSKETRQVQAAPETSLKSVDSKTIELKYLVYQPTELPLKEFFFHLKRGDYKTAFQKVDFSYHGSNFNDEALEELLQAGFVPVYAHLKNTGTVPLKIDEKSFALNVDAVAEKAFYSDQLPSEFKHFSPKAVAANVYNTSVVIVGFAAVIALLVAMGPSSSPGFHLPEGQPSFDNPVFNDTENTVRVDYRTLLISKTVLQPGDETKGLLFFNVDSGHSLTKATLSTMIPEGGSQ